jgi:acetoacetyl-CoA synthetase
VREATGAGTARELLWTPSEQRTGGSRMADFQAWVNRDRYVPLVGYDELWSWSVEDLDGFWGAVWSYFDVLASAQPSAVLAERAMPGAVWFPGARLNLAENVLRHARDDHPAVVGTSEHREREVLTGRDLVRQVASLAEELRAMGVRPGDRVAAYLPNIPQAVVALLATAAVGAIWSCCAPDFGTDGVLDRFRQIEPTVLFGVDGYCFAGRDVERLDTLAELSAALPSVRHTVVVEHLRAGGTPPAGALSFDALVAGDPPPRYEQVPFDHPLWILYSSGTTGVPKGIVHSHGGILLEHLKSHALHFDTGPDDRVFVYASTAWMVWNVLVTALGVGATIVTYDGNPVRPEPDQLFAICAAERVTRFGTGAAYLTGCQRAARRPGEQHNLAALRAICSTGSPLPTSTWHWVYDKVKRDLLLGSDCGGTDVCTAFIGTNPLLPVYAGEMQAPYLGVRVDSWSPEGTPLVDEVGEMVITEPMPSMPVAFWNDAGGARYREAYFDTYPGTWRHGDWMTITRYGTYVVHGRSDSTINRGGVRMGSADIYAVVDRVPGVAASLVIGAELADGGYFMPLFVALAAGTELTPDLIDQIRQDIRARVSPRHVPDEVVAVPAIPMTITGKKVEVPIKRLLQGVPEDKAVNRATLANPEALDWFLAYVTDRRATQGLQAEAARR